MTPWIVFVTLALLLKKPLTSVSSLCVSEALLAACSTLVLLAGGTGVCRMLERQARMSM
jgi:hypothetical protein